MGMGQELLDDARWKHELEEMEAEREARDKLFDELGAKIRQAGDLQSVKDLMIVMLNLIKDRT